jgi:hypothetical protein
VTAITSLGADGKRNQRIGRSNDCLPSVKRGELHRVTQITASSGEMAEHKG